MRDEALEEAKKLIGWLHERDLRHYRGDIVAARYECDQEVKRVQKAIEEALKPMKLIFLDIDGVLNSTAWHTKQHEARQRGEPEEPWPQRHIDPDAVAVLNEIIEKTGAYVVVTSTWRIGQLRAWCHDQLAAKGFKGKVIGVTPVLDGKRRGDEIQDWLTNASPAYWRRLGEVTHFVILDDDTDMEHLYPKLVHIDYATGLTREHLPLVMQHLEGERCHAI